MAGTDTASAASASDNAEPREWSPAQVVRLEGEWRRLQRDFAFHPHVEIIPLSGDPPDEYQVEYTVTTLAIGAEGQLTYVGSCPVHVWLPPDFPERGPVIRPMADAFHPNIMREWVHLQPGWDPDTSLAEVVTRVGELLAYQTCHPDPHGVLNPDAMQWVNSNAGAIPTDPAADFSADAAGGPLARIAEFGTRELDELRDAADALCGRLLSGVDPPADPELRQFGTEARRTLERFLEPDIPQRVRTFAGELEELVVSMQGSASVWLELARDVRAAREVSEAVERVAAIEESLSKALSTAAAVPAAEPPAEPRHERAVDGKRSAGPLPLELSAVPALETIQPVALNLRSAVQEADEAVATLWKALAQLGRPPRSAGLVPGTLLARRLDRETVRVTAAAAPARGAGAVLASVEPVLERARCYAEAAEQVAGWGEYAGWVRTAEELVERLLATGTADLQAYRVNSGATASTAVTSGPFEFEQPIEVFGTRMAVSNHRANVVRVFDPQAEELIAAGESVATVAAPEPLKESLSVRLTEHTDELRVQLEYVLTQTKDAVERLAPDRPANAEEQSWPLDFWAGTVAAELDTPQVRRAVREAHRRVAHRWKLVLGDLAALGRFKQRLATYHLLSRLVEFVPRANGRLEGARDVLARAETRLREILARSARDPETEHPIVPQHLAKEYAERLAERDDARQDLLRFGRALDAAAQRVRTRLAKRKLYGGGGPPSFRVLPAPPAELTNRSPHLTDAAIEALVDRLEGLMHVKLQEIASPDGP